MGGHGLKMINDSDPLFTLTSISHTIRRHSGYLGVNCIYDLVHNKKVFEYV